MRTKEDKKAYDMQYAKEHVIRKIVTFNAEKEEDMALLEWLEKQPESVAAYIKKLIRADMEK